MGWGGRVFILVLVLGLGLGMVIAGMGMRVERGDRSGFKRRRQVCVWLWLGPKACSEWVDLITKHSVQHA
jgi:hypothetical protein